MADKEFISSLDAAYKAMLAAYGGGLSNTSTSKFIGIRNLFLAALGLTDERSVYCIGAGTRPGNIEVRLNQGNRSAIHTVLGVAFIKPERAEDVSRQSDSAVTTISFFLNRGKGRYEAVLVIAEIDATPIPTRLVVYNDCTVRQQLGAMFEGLSGFKITEIERNEEPSSVSQRLHQSATEELEYWTIDSAPRGGAFEYPIQRLVEGCPGSGKSFLLDRDAQTADRVIRTIFHPEFGFSDFVGYLSPATAFRIETPQQTYTPPLCGSPVVYYSFCHGPLLEAYLLAVLNPSHKIVLIIEELSRAPASLVFGDTLQLLDRVGATEKHDGLPPVGFSRYQIRPKGEVKRVLEELEAAPPYTQPGGMRFPDNLYIWATMNRADQNAKQLDTAFLRRWRREHLSHDAAGINDGVNVSMRGDAIPWGKFRQLVNSALISGGATEDKLVGPYFLPVETLQSPERIADELLAYVWYDVLREESSDMFPGCSTFSDIRRDWLAGKLGFMDD